MFSQMTDAVVGLLRQHHASLSPLEQRGLASRDRR